MFNLKEYILSEHGKKEEERQNLIQQQYNNQVPNELVDPVNDPRVRIIQRPAVENNAVQAKGYNANDSQESDDVLPAPIVQDQSFNSSAAALVLILYGISIGLIVYGVIHLKDCPAENMIAISFIVIGGLSFISRILSCPYEWRKLFNKGDPEHSPGILCLMCLNMVFQIAVLCFFLAICYWIFSMKPDTKPEDHLLPNYCDLQFYRNTFYGCIIGLVFLGLIICALCCGCCALCCIAIAQIADE